MLPLGFVPNKQIFSKEVAAKTDHRQQAQHRGFMTEVAMVDFLLDLVPDYMQEYLAKLPKDVPQETWDEIIVHLTEAQEQKDKEVYPQGCPGGG